MRPRRAVVLLVSVGTLACRRPASSGDPERGRRETMVRTQIAARGVKDPRVLRAMAEVPRHLFLDPALRRDAYADRPVSIGEGHVGSFLTYKTLDDRRSSLLT